MILTPRQFQDRLDRNQSFRVLDLRAAETARTSPLAGLKAQVVDRATPIPPEDRPTLLICEVGIVTEDIIEKQGLENTFSLLGGAQAWDAFVHEKMDLSRWSRQTALPELGVEGQRLLGAAKVAIVGMGGLGCPAAQSLAAAGIGHLILIDGDRVELSNLHRQPLYGEADIDRAKVEAAAEKLGALVSGTEVVAHDAWLDDTNATALLEGIDVVLDATDNLKARRALDAASRTLGIPLVYGALFRFEGQVAVLNHRGGPGYTDLFPDNDGRADTCADAGVLGMLPGIIGHIQALEAVKLVTGIETGLAGRLLIYDGLSHATTLIDL